MKIFHSYVSNVSIFIIWIQIVEATWWLLGTDESHFHDQTLNDMSLVDTIHKTHYCDHFPYFINHQRKLCRDSGGKIITTISAGAKLGIGECQYQLKSYRWNCSVIQEAQNAFGKVLDIHSREKAFVHAISAAALAYEVTKACTRGQLDKCSCDEGVRNQDTKGKWEWGGCSEDVRYGTQFTKEFIDSMENSTTPEGLMNLHNNEAGRRLVKTSMNTTCKCHGVSGSCTMKVCWKVLTPFRGIAEKIGEKFEGAFRVRPVLRDGLPPQYLRRGKPISLIGSESIESRSLATTHFRLKPFANGMKRPSKKDLVFIEESPDYCEQNQTLNVLGTKGRICNRTNDRGSGDSCLRLCCSRGYQTMIRSGMESCNCQFVWCCRVQCEMCPFKREEYVCN